jgi:glycosyltransferase 2 family protein
MKNKKFFLFLRIGMTLAIFFALFKFIPYEKLITIYKESKKSYIFSGIGIFFICQIIGVNRWRFLLSSLGIQVPLKESFYSFFSGLFFNLFFPSFVAGDVFRGFTISYRYGGAKRVASSVLMDRYSGAMALTIIALLSYAFSGNILRDNRVGIALLILCGLLGFISLIIFSKHFFLFLTKVLRRSDKLEKKLFAVHDQLYFFRQRPAVFFKSLLFSIPIQGLVVVSFFMVAKGFGIQTNILNFFILVPIITAISLVPITIAGFGTREAAAVYFFGLVGIAKSVGFGVSLLNGVFLILMGILGGIFYVTIYHRCLQPSP